MSLTIDEIIGLEEKIHSILGWKQRGWGCLDLSYNSREQGDLYLYCDIRLDVLRGSLTESIPALHKELQEALGDYAEKIEIYDGSEDSPSGYFVAIKLNKETRQ